MTLSAHSGEGVPEQPGTPMEGQIIPVRVPRTLVAEVISNLRKAIQDGPLSSQRELPTEPELARQLGVSRGTLRQAIAILEQEGLLSRRQGLGTFIVPHTARLKNVLNNNYGVTDLIRNTGGTPGTGRLDVAPGTADARVAENLGISPGDPLVVIERVRTDDDIPVAFTIDYLSDLQLENRGIDIDAVEQALRVQGSLYKLLRGAGLVIDGAVAEVRSVIADNKLAEALNIKPKAPVLMLSQTDYGAGGVPILYSDEYLPSDVTIQVWRKGPG
jgi:GntR family transcriptional regulator